MPFLVRCTIRCVPQNSPQAHSNCANMRWRCWELRHVPSRQYLSLYGPHSIATSSRRIDKFYTHESFNSFVILTWTRIIARQQSSKGFSWDNERLTFGKSGLPARKYMHIRFQLQRRADSSLVFRSVQCHCTVIPTASQSIPQCLISILTRRSTCITIGLTV